jgi:GntR family transcriptional regulator
MLVTLDPRDERPLYLQIIDQVRRALLVGTLRAEDPLPSVRELAGQLVVNPRTVSQAYQQLESEGVIYVRRGQGTFVAPTIPPDRSERRMLVRGVAERALRDARRAGLGVEELVTMIIEVAAEEEEKDTVAEPSPTSRKEGAA